MSFIKKSSEAIYNAGKSLSDFKERNFERQKLKFAREEQRTILEIKKLKLKNALEKERGKSTKEKSMFGSWS